MAEEEDGDMGCKEDSMGMAKYTDWEVDQGVCMDNGIVMDDGIPVV